jgi:Flp pilus assembly protein TadB
MPVALIGLLMIINPNYLLRVFQTTIWCGWTMFTVAAVMIISGVIVIQKVIDVRV